MPGLLGMRQATKETKIPLLELAFSWREAGVQQAPGQGKAVQKSDLGRG